MTILSDRPPARPRIVMSRWRDLALECSSRDDELAAPDSNFLRKLLARQSIAREELNTLSDIAVRLGLLGGAQ